LRHRCIQTYAKIYEREKTFRDRGSGFVMTKLNQKKLDLFANKILEDYDAKNPGTIFKTKIKLSNDDALLLQ